MALTATMRRFAIELADVDRGIYESLDLRVAQHPSETVPFLLTRVLAYALSYEEGIAFSRGLAAADEPAIWVRDLQGNVQAVVEIGNPSPERLHRATKAVPRVGVFTHHDVELLKRALRGKRVHRLAEVQVYAIDGAFLETLQSTLERTNVWTLSRSDGEVYLSGGEWSLSTRPVLHELTSTS